MKQWLLILALCLLQIALPAQQRLALLPIEGDESALLSLCLDFFRDAPSGETYNQVQNGIGNKIEGLRFQPDSYDQIAVTRNGQSASKEITEPLFLSASSDIEGITKQKKEFVHDRFLRLKSDPTYTQLKFQDEVWAFDILEVLGYIEKNAPAENAYQKALAKFGADFMADGTKPTPRQIKDVGAALKQIFLYEKSNKIIVIKSPFNKTLLAFTEVAPPVYRGSNSTDALSTVIAKMTNDGGTVEIVLDGFENELREKAFMVELKRKIFLTHSKDVVLTSSMESYVWDPAKLKITNQPTITTNTAGVHATYSSSVKLNDAIGTFATVEVASNKRPPLNSFITQLVERVKAQKNEFILPKAVRSIRQTVMKDMNISNGDYIDALILAEGRYKTIVKIHGGKITICTDYVSRN